MRGSSPDLACEVSLEDDLLTIKNDSWKTEKLPNSKIRGNEEIVSNTDNNEK